MVRENIERKERLRDSSSGKEIPLFWWMKKFHLIPIPFEILFPELFPLLLSSGRNSVTKQTLKSKR
jgi:hypothetical protein